MWWLWQILHDSLWCSFSMPSTSRVLSPTVQVGTNTSFKSAEYGKYNWDDSPLIKWCCIINVKFLQVSLSFQVYWFGINFKRLSWVALTKSHNGPKVRDWTFNEIQVFNFCWPQRRKLQLVPQPKVKNSANNCVSLEVESSSVKPLDENTNQLITCFQSCESQCKGPRYAIYRLMTHWNWDNKFVFSFLTLTLW